MTNRLATHRGRIWLGGAVATGLIATGCGSSYSTPAPATHAAHAKAAAPVHAVGRARLRVLFPRSGAHAYPDSASARATGLHDPNHHHARRPSGGGIPQHNGGDGDSDNNGGPSDGDGNI